MLPPSALLHEGGAASDNRRAAPTGVLRAGSEQTDVCLQTQPLGETLRRMLTPLVFFLLRSQAPSLTAAQQIRVKQL